jgi:uncharacterized protein YegL
MRRLPVYLLLDVSGSMSGEPIVSVENGLKMLQTALRRDPQAMETAFISVITFESNVKQILPLTEVAAFVPPALRAGGGTSLGEALKVVVDCASKEVNKGTSAEKGDWKPLVFIMTDGVPTDDVNRHLSNFRAYKWGLVLGCAAGHGADTTVLQQICGENVITLDTCDAATMEAYFKFVSASIVTASKKVDSGDQLSSLSQLPPPPPEISLLKP